MGGSLRTLSARRLATVTVVLTLGTAAIATADAASRPPTTTVVRTIRDTDGDRRLEDAPGGTRVVRDELAAASASDRVRAATAAAAALGRSPAPAAQTRLLTFAHLSDMHVVDEESPLRMELVDFVLGRSYRPQDGLTPHVLERMVVAVREAVSPVSGRGAEVAVTTGDNTDTGQRNEIRWFIDLLDGGTLDPDSGVPGSCGLPTSECGTRASGGRTASTSRTGRPRRRRSRVRVVRGREPGRRRAAGPRARTHPGCSSR